jgi:hypothetical protein
MRHCCFVAGEALGQIQKLIEGGRWAVRTLGGSVRGYGRSGLVLDAGASAGD